MPWSFLRIFWHSRLVHHLTGANSVACIGDHFAIDGFGEEVMGEWGSYPCMLTLNTSHKASPCGMVCVNAGGHLHWIWGCEKCKQGIEIKDTCCFTHCAIRIVRKYLLQVMDLYDIPEEGKIILMCLFWQDKSGQKLHFELICLCGVKKHDLKPSRCVVPDVLVIPLWVLNRQKNLF